LLLLAPYAAVADGVEPTDVDIFNSIDGDGDGRITQAELLAAAAVRGIELTAEQVEAFLAADADGDGVDLQEFLDSVDETMLGRKRKDSGDVF
jgi:Ca2+-binding EF-hand superfamily protein